MSQEKQTVCVYVDRLKGDNEEEIAETIDPQALGMQESDELTVTAPVEIEGRAYMADEYLVVDLDITASITIPCAFCNQDFVLDVDVQHSIHEEPISDIKHGVFDIIPLVREAIFLEVPLYPLCGGKVCLHRDEIEKYLKKESVEEGYQPFIDI